MPRKRIEINKKVGAVRVRASRTGGASLSTSPTRGITLNTKHGLRLSKTFKGLTLGTQNSRSVVRGRWGTDNTKINLSKSGFSVSQKNALGTYNFRRPKLSSANIMGVQVRGALGRDLALAGLAISLITVLIQLAFWLLWLAFSVAVVVIRFSYRLILFLGSLLIFLLIDLPRQLRAKQTPATH
jgi:hypothetical protein